jgi:undecaprenyl-diphosphatase
MILTMPLLGIDGENRFWNGAFDIFIQLGAILAVVIYFWPRLYRLTMKFERDKWHEHILVKLFVAFLPAAVLGLLFKKFIEEQLKNPLVTATALVVGGLLILLIEWRVKEYRVHDAALITLKGALFVGLAQALSMIPGTSRSAATIMGALIIGMAPAAAAEFSFFLAIPTLGAAGLYSLYDHRAEVSADGALCLAIGFVVSFIVAWIVVAGFMRFIQTHKFTSFAIYRIILGTVVIAAVFNNFI